MFYTYYKNLLLELFNRNARGMKDERQREKQNICHMSSKMSIKPHRIKSKKRNGIDSMIDGYSFNFKDLLKMYIM